MLFFMFAIAASWCLPETSGSSLKLPFPRSLLKPEPNYNHQSVEPTRQSQWKREGLALVSPSPSDSDSNRATSDSPSFADDDDDWSLSGVVDGHHEEGGHMHSSSLARSGSGSSSGGDGSGGLIATPLLKRINIAGLKMVST